MAAIEDFVALKEINYACMASSQNRFVLSDSPIAVNLSKCKNALCSLCKSKKAPYSSFYKDEWFLDSGASTVTTLTKAQVAILGKGLRRSKGIMQLVKHKNTGMYLHYLCESIVQQQDIHEN